MGPTQHGVWEQARQVRDARCYALGALERSFPYGTTTSSTRQLKHPTMSYPWNEPADVDSSHAGKLYESSTNPPLRRIETSPWPDLQAIWREGPGGSENFRSPNRDHRYRSRRGYITNRELNEIVKNGIKKQFVWVNVCYNIFKENPNTPWQTTFEAIPTALP